MEPYYQKECRQLFPRKNMQAPQQMLATLARSQSPSKQRRHAEACPGLAAPDRCVQKYNRRLTPRQKQLIVHLRYGSRTHFHQVVRTISAVGKRLGLPWMTVKNALTRFVAAGHRWPAVRWGRPAKVVPPRVAATILSKQWLQDHAAFSLHERVLIIERDLGYKFCARSLHAFFHANAIRFRQTRWVYRQANDMPYKLRQRIDYARLLANVMLAGTHQLVFFDESSFNGWMGKSKAWTRYDQVITVPLNKEQHRATVFGAIGPALKKNMFCDIYSTTNGFNFRQFLPRLKKALRNPYSRQKTYLCLDNHQAHLAHKSTKLMQDLGFEPLWLPSYSSYFNSVEHLWSLLKTHFRKLMCIQKTHLSYDQFTSLVRQTFPLVTEDMARNLCFANRKYLCEQLQKGLEARAPQP